MIDLVVLTVPRSQVLCTDQCWSPPFTAGLKVDPKLPVVARN